MFFVGSFRLSFPKIGVQRQNNETYVKKKKVAGDVWMYLQKLDLQANGNIPKWTLPILFWK